MSNPPGRRPGQLIKRTREIATRATREGITPLEYMLKVMRNPKADIVRRDDMAKAAAPYVHPRLQSIELEGQVPEAPGRIDVLVIARQVALTLTLGEQKLTPTINQDTQE